MDFGLDDDELKKPLRGLGDFHLRSAIVPINISELLLGQGKRREQRSFNSIIRQIPNIVAGDPADLLAQILLGVKGLQPREIPKLEETKRLLNAEFEQLSWLRGENDPMAQLMDYLDEIGGVQSQHTEMKIKLQRLLMCANAMNSDRDYSAFNLPSHPNWDKPYQIFGPVMIVTWGELITASSEYLSPSVYSMDVLRMLTDKVTERDNVLLSSHIGNKIFPSIYPSPKTIKGVFNILDEWVYDQGNAGYTLLKAYEALLTGIILRRDTSPYLDTSEFLRNTINGLKDNEQEIAWKLIQYIESRSPTPHHLTQLMGLFRLWGHPEVDAKKGVEKVRKIGTASKTISEHASIIAGRKFKEIFYREYFQRNRCYPKCRVLDSCWFKENITSETPINFKDPRYHISDWDSVSSDETYQSPTTFNLSMIVSDTAISPTRREIYQCKTEGRPPMDPFIRRGVLKWMKDGLIDCQELLSEIDENPEGLDKEYRIIGLYPKEREMNPIARMFALMTLKMRSYVVITENMLSDNILPNVPGITMTYNMLDLAKEMIKITRAQGSQGEFSRTFCINMDFEKWNLNMRKEATYYTFLELGRLFGMPNLYNRTYDIFRNSIIYLADGSYTPDIDEDLNLHEKDNNLAYEGHIGGFEGLRQKGWTIFTVVMIAHICDQLGIQYRLMGQGDNQVLMVTIHSKHARLSGIDSGASISEISSTLNKLLIALQENFQMVGLPLKPLETWVSDTYFSYGKIPIHKGVPLCSSLKRISRVFFFSNEDLMTIDNALGAVTANAQAAVMADVHPVIPYFIAKWQHLQCLSIFSKYHPLVGDSMINTDEEINFYMKLKGDESWNAKETRRYSIDILLMVMATVPKTLGGLNIVTFFDMILRGYSDPPMKDLQFLYLMYKGTRGELKHAIKNWLRVCLSPSIDYLHLIQDPTALNILCPPNSNTIIKRMIHSTIDSIDSESEFSTWFKELMGISAEKKVEGIVAKLSAGPEINVRLCHDILGATLYGYSEAISAKVDKTVTLSRMTVARNDVVTSLARGEIRMWRYFEWRTHYSRGERFQTKCPATQIRYLREKGWQKKIIGISTPYPFHYITLNERDTDRPDSYIEVVISDRVLSHPQTLINSSGTSLPYLGSVTKEKLHSTAARAAYGTEPLITRPLRLMRAIGWFIDENSNFATSIRSLLTAVTDLPADDIIVIPEHVKGSMMHRYQDMATDHGALWMPSFGPPSHLSLSTNSFAEYAKGSKNVTLHFQATLGLIQFASINRAMSSNHRKMLKFFRSCTECILPVDNPKEDLIEALTVDDIPSRPKNPYLYVDKEQIHLVHKLELESYENIPSVSKQFIVDNPGIGRNFLMEILAIKVASNILFANKTELGEITDVSGIGRTVFLKLNPLHTFLTVLKALWIGASSGPRISGGEIFPSWNYMKKTISRRIWEAPAAAFLTLAGFYLWDDTIRVLSCSKWAVMPLSYPATPHSVSQAAKNSLIRLLHMTKELRRPSSWLVSPLIKIDPGLLVKGNLLFWKGLPKTKCQSCWTSGMGCKIRANYEWKDIQKIKCEYGHSVFTLKGWRKLRKINLDVETLADNIPSVPITEDHHIAIYLDLGGGREVGSSLFGSDDIDGISSLEHRLPGSEYLERPAPLLSQLLEFNLPTRSLYRIYEIMTHFHNHREIGRILVLGDGYGYSSMMAKMFCPKAKVFSWTLIDTSASVQHCLRQFKPPTHYSLGFDIDCSASIERVSDITNIEFPGELAEFVDENKIDLIISEVELMYSNSTMEPGKLIRLYWESKASAVILKFEVDCFSNLKIAIEHVWRYFRQWKVIQTPNAGLHTGDVFILMYDRITSSNNWEYLSYNNTMLLYERLRIAHETMNDWYPGDYCNTINQTLQGTPLETFREQLLDVWFQDSTIQYWREKDCTQLYYSLRTGRRPQSVFDAAGNTVYYLHGDLEEKIFERLFTLAMASIKDIEEKIARIIAQNWRLKWERTSSIVGTRSEYKWAPSLVSGGRQAITDRMRNNIYRYLPGVIAVIKRQRPKQYDDVSQYIRFEPDAKKRGEKKQKARFPITKQASFSTPMG
ncbi:putative L protein [Maize associated rhabdovirus]|uniref:Replicase n=1 Tax=Maize associated rhabdovirus TaxID=2003308 RepID=A0A1X9Y2V4_9RHAB|nr:putative L protein [Maize associated rhabdovirus]ARS22495.1 putative L protein [Maize associated rhabdovirus]